MRFTGQIIVGLGIFALGFLVCGATAFTIGLLFLLPYQYPFFSIVSLKLLMLATVGAVFLYFTLRTIPWLWNHEVRGQRNAFAIGAITILAALKIYWDVTHPNASPIPDDFWGFITAPAIFLLGVICFLAAGAAHWLASTDNRPDVPKSAPHP